MSVSSIPTAMDRPGAKPPGPKFKKWGVQLHPRISKKQVVGLKIPKKQVGAKAPGPNSKNVERGMGVGTA